MADQHVKFLAFGCEYKVLTDVAKVSYFLETIIERIGMQKLGGPHVYSVPDELRKMGEKPDPDEPDGICGVCVLTTSHVAIHTWPHRKYCLIDIFSCREFDTEIARQAIKELLGPKLVCHHDLSFSMEGLGALPIVRPPR